MLGEALESQLFSSLYNIFIEELMYKADFINMNSLQSTIKQRFDQTRRDIFRVQARQLQKNNLYISLQRVISELVSGLIYPVLGFLPGSEKLSGGHLASAMEGRHFQHLQKIRHCREQWSAACCSVSGRPPPPFRLCISKLRCSWVVS